MNFTPILEGTYDMSRISTRSPDRPSYKADQSTMTLAQMRTGHPATGKHTGGGLPSNRWSKEAQRAVADAAKNKPA
jgi:hypothetical protein